MGYVYIYLEPTDFLNFTLGSITGLGGDKVNDMLAVAMADADVHKHVLRYIWVWKCKLCHDGIVH